MTDTLPQPHLADLAGRINAEHQQAEKALERGLSHARTAGELLLEAKAKCGHGTWLPWLRSNVHFSERTAQAYMQVARRWDELVAKAQHVADLPYRNAVALLVDKKEDPEEPRLRPALNPGERYSAAGRSQFGRALVELDPHPDHPGFWVMTRYHLIDGCDVGFCDFLGRGVRLDNPEVFDAVVGQPGIHLTTEWFAEPASSETPFAVTEYRRQRDAERSGVEGLTK